MSRPEPRTIATSVATLLATAALAVFYLDGAAAETRQMRLTRAEVTKACLAAEGMLWGGEEATGEPAAQADGRYGCISPSGWIECDRFTNCVGGNGAAQRFGAVLPGRPGGKN